MNCPECKERLSTDASRCVCGWTKERKFSVDPFRGRCSWTDGLADRCNYPGTLSHALRGDGSFMCAFHFFNGDPVHASRITQESHNWDGKAESYALLRAAHQERKAAFSKEGATGSGVDAHSGSTRVDGVPVAIRELVQALGIQRPGAQEA